MKERKHIVEGKNKLAEKERLIYKRSEGEGEKKKGKKHPRRAMRNRGGREESKIDQRKGLDRTNEGKAKIRVISVEKRKKYKQGATKCFIAS